MTKQEVTNLVETERVWCERIITKVDNPRQCMDEMRKVMREIAAHPPKATVMHAVNVASVLALLPIRVLLAWSKVVQDWYSGDEEIPEPVAEC